MYLHFKQSGELLSGHGELWAPKGVIASADKIETVFGARSRLDVEGILLVSGAGNIVRGEHLRKHNIANGKADLLGRLATVQNTVVLAQSLEDRDIPTAVFIADTMSIADISVPKGYLEPYNIDAVRDAYDRERVVLIAGGTGEDNKTTDNAVLEYARRHREGIGAEDSVLVLKGTKYDGVYDGDPATNARARRFGRISAGHMIKHYDDFPVVDLASLHTINNSGLDLRVYADGRHDLEMVLRNPESVGTLIVPGHDLPSFPVAA